MGHINYFYKCTYSVAYDIKSVIYVYLIGHCPVYGWMFIYRSALLLYENNYNRIQNNSQPLAFFEQNYKMA